MTDLSFQKVIFNLHQGEMCLGAIALIYFKNSLSKQSNVFLWSWVDKNIIVEIFILFENMPFESRAWQLTDNSINASSFKYLVTNAKQETPLGLVSVRLDVIICTKCWVCLEFFEHVYISMDDFEAVKNTQWNTEFSASSNRTRCR